MKLCWSAVCLWQIHIQMFPLKFYEGYQLIMQHFGDLATFLRLICKNAPGLCWHGRRIRAKQRFSSDSNLLLCCTVSPLASFLCKPSISTRQKKNAKIGFQDIKADVVLLVLHPGSGVLLRPVFTKQPGSVVFPLQPGENRREVVFSCEAQGHPPPFYR